MVHNAISQASFFRSVWLSWLKFTTEISIIDLYIYHLAFPGSGVEGFVQLATFPGPNESRKPNESSIAGGSRIS